VCRQFYAVGLWVAHVRLLVAVLELHMVIVNSATGRLPGFGRFG
jgi:hypothetical protein